MCLYGARRVVEYSVTPSSSICIQAPGKGALKSVGECQSAILVRLCNDEVVVTLIALLTRFTDFCTLVLNICELIVLMAQYAHNL